MCLEQCRAADKLKARQGMLNMTTTLRSGPGSWPWCSPSRNESGYAASLRTRKRTNPEHPQPRRLQHHGRHPLPSLHAGLPEASSPRRNSCNISARKPPGAKSGPRAFGEVAAQCRNPRVQSKPVTSKTGLTRREKTTRAMYMLNLCKHRDVGPCVIPRRSAKSSP